MNWFQLLATKDKAEGKGKYQNFALPEEIQEAFNSQQNFLVWMALIITGDIEQASQSVVDAAALTHNPGSVFRDWLTQWARMATLKSAIQLARHKIASEVVPAVPCDHVMHPCLSADQVQALQNAWAVELLLRLDFLARVALITRGVQNLPVQECALLVGTTRSNIQLAYCRALRSCETNELFGPVEYSSFATPGSD